MNRIDKIRQTLTDLDPENAELWTGNGLPKVEVIQANLE